MMLRELAVAAVLALSATALAQAKPAEPAKGAEKKADAGAKKDEKAGMQAPVMPPEGKKWVESNWGNWKSSDVVFNMGDKALKGKMTMKCDKAVGGWGAVCNGKMDLGKEMPAQDVAFLMGWSIGEGQATMFEVSSMGEVHSHTGKWTDDKTISLTHQGKNPEGKVETDTVTFTWNAPKEIALKAEGTVEGKAAWSFTATMKK